MKNVIVFAIVLTFQISVFGQKDSIYYKKIADPATSMIQLKEGYKIFSQKFGTGKIKLLLLHGGPLNSHEGFEIFINQLPFNKYTIIFYDQLGSYYSDQPTDSTLWTIPRFVDEVEQVRQFYKLDSFYLLGHSWGGLLAMEYSIKYPDRLKGLVISNKSYSQENLVNTRKKLNIQIAKKLNCSSKTVEQMSTGQRITDSTEAVRVTNEFNRQHMVRLDSLPDAINRVSKHISMTPRYIKQSYFHDRVNWNILDRLYLIKQPTLLIGSKYDIVKIDELNEMKKRIPNSKLYICPNGGHFDFWDDTENYFNALQKFIKETEKYYR